jgi:acyl-CoA thioesterase-1
MVRYAAISIACVFACANCAIGVPGLINQLKAGQSQKVVVYGTSLTAGGAWVSQLSSALNAQYPGKITWVNAGLSGKASNSGVANLSSMVLSQNPDAVFIEFGMNDAFTAYPMGDIDKDITPTQSKANLNSMIDSILAARPNCEVVLQTMNPAWDASNGNQSGTIRPNLDTYYQGYREVASQRGLRIVDNYATWLKLQSNQQSLFESYVADGTHPNATGSQQLVTPSIRSVLGAENGLALLIDPASGRAAFQNQSAAAIDLVGYTISSTGGALKTTWSGFTKQGKANWFEAHPSANNLSELNPTGSLFLAPRAAIDLGITWNATGPLDVVMNYQTSDLVNHVGLVAFTPTANDIITFSGDYNRNQVVDAADYVLWRKALNSSVPNGTRADGSGNGVIDVADYNVWRSNFGKTSAGSGAGTLLTSAVPEPTGGLLGAIALAFALSGCRPGRSPGLFLRRHRTGTRVLRAGERQRSPKATDAPNCVVV